jgi:hypothetical protein
MDEDPSDEAFVLSLLEGYNADEAEAMDTEPTPRVEDWRDKYIAWMDRGELPSDRSEARRIARMAKSFTLVDAKGEKVKINSKPSPQPSDESEMDSSDDFSDEEANQLVSEMDKQSRDFMARLIV